MKGRNGDKKTKLSKDTLRASTKSTYQIVTS